MSDLSSDKRENKEPHVAVLMATYNGAPHLQEQLDSLAAQTHANWSLRVGDDGSTDATAEIVENFGAEGHSVTVRQNGGHGTAANFMSLLRHLPSDDARSDWIAFTDQDDVWLAEKLTYGISALREHPLDIPVLYCSRTWVTDSTLTSRNLSPPRPRAPGFCNALVQNIASGNTILLNPAAAALVKGAAHEAGHVVMHDWWIYQIVTGSGGLVVHDDRPTLLYRQHDGNVIGSNAGTKALLQRVGMILNGEFRRWNDVNVAALERSAHRLTPEHRNTIRGFAEARQARLLSRLLAFRKLGLYSQTSSRTWALWLAILLGRV